MDLGQPGLDVVQEPVELGVDRGPVGLVVHAVQHRFDRGPHALGRHAHQVRGVVRAATLPGRAGQVRRDGFDQARVRVAGDQAHAGQAAGCQVGEELVPRGTGFAGGHAQAEDLAVPVSVDPDRDQRDGVDHPAPFADLHRECVRGHERERSRLGQRPVAELLHDLVQISGHPRDLRLAQPVDPQGFHELVHAAGADPGEVAVSDDGDQRRLRALAALEQPFGEVGPGPQLRDRHVDRADTRVEVTVAVPVALRGAGRAGPAVLGPDHRVGVSREQRVDDRLQQRSHQIRAGLSQGFTQQASRVDNVWCGHRDDSIRECCERFARRITRWPHPRPLPGRSRRPRYTTIRDSTPRGPERLRGVGTDTGRKRAS